MWMTMVPLPKNEDDNGPSIGLMWGFSKLITVKHLTWCLGHVKHP